MKTASGPFLVAVLAALATAGCERSRTAPSRRPVRLALAVARGFDPPADGLLTPAQVDAYVRVRRAAKGRSDGDAARAVGFSPDELAWVRSRVVEALVALDQERVRQASLEVYARTLASLRRTLEGVQDPETARKLQEQIAGLERERASLRREDSHPAPVAENIRRIASRRAEIARLSP